MADLAGELRRVNDSIAACEQARADASNAAPDEGGADRLVALERQMAQLQGQKQILLQALVAPMTQGPHRVRELLRAKAPGAWGSQTAASSSSSTKRPYPDCAVVTWDLNTGTKQQIHRHLNDACQDASLQDNPCGPWHSGLILFTEADCNSMFASCFGLPAAAMLSAVVGEEITFSQELRDDPSKGVADFWFGGGGGGPGRVLLVGEGKKPTVLKSSESLCADIMNGDATALSCAHQVCSYMLNWGMTYGFLTYLNGTFFIERRAQHEYAFTNAVNPDDADPTVLEMLMYVLMKQKEAGPWVSAPGVPRAIPAGALPAAGDAAGAPQYPLRSRAAAGGGASGGQQLCIYDPQQQHTKSALEVTNERLGMGKCGGVLVGRFYGQLAAIKALDVSKQGHLLPQMRAEVLAYNRLRSLQGVCIPVLYGCGFWDDGRAYFVATSIVAGQHAGRGVRGGSEAAEQALREVHALGILHGDIRAQNVLVAADGGHWKAWLIDFDSSSESHDPDAQAAELAALRALFRPSDTDASTTSETAWD